ncbi:hypothetical protein H310_12747 [Aphanomyces invadans]|uniref:Uncharacterized protein n=1 Tax=Aphanomyces invadans TaxID=157072 RepID=A0A024THR9_9STRA|nr:hypothetical protein H310_12747 [Aphanomyces invadans]ETV93136.1 hypothetical protein H310_12747 [Aphanomyces invadans]|eukprot:XP_008878158.1 hypothetical protein H310_12747 [Aphanomyces invadans]
MYGKREANSIFGSVPFNPDDQQRTDAYLRQKLNANFLSRRPGPGGRRLTYLESCKAIEIANEAFGFNGWSCRIVDCNVECKEKTDDGKWTVIYSSVVRIELKDGASHEDVGFGQSEGMKDLGAALEQAKKASISDARKRALRLFGEYLGNSCYDKEHIKDVAANRANHSTLQSPTSIKIENGQVHTPSGMNTPPLHPPRAALSLQAPTAAPHFQPPPREIPSPVSSECAVDGRAKVGDGHATGNSFTLHGPPANTSNLPSHQAPTSLQQKQDVRLTPGTSAMKAEPRAVSAPLNYALAPRNPPPGTIPAASWNTLANSSSNYTPGIHPAHDQHAIVISRAPTPCESRNMPTPPTFHRPMPRNTTLSSPSMQPVHSTDNSADINRKRCLDVYGANATSHNSRIAAVDDLDGLRLSQFEFDDGSAAVAKKARP